MSKFVQAAQSSQALSLTAVEEASRQGLRDADLEHLFLALVLSDQAAGRVLRELGMGIEDARRAVREQHDAQLASLGVQAELPEPGRIVSHETDGYELTRRAVDLMGRAIKKDRAGSASAVLRELVVEPSGLIADILQRLGSSPQEVLERLDQAGQEQLGETGRKRGSATAAPKDRTSASTQAFVPAPVKQVLEFLSDPARIPEWAIGVASIDDLGQESRPGAVWEARAPQTRPDGKPLRVRPGFLRRQVELVSVDPPHHVAWRFSYPDAPRSRPVLTELALAETTGGTQVTITTSWTRPTGWRRLAGLPLRPLSRFMVWLSLFQTGSAISRAFR